METTMEQASELIGTIRRTGATEGGHPALGICALIDGDMSVSLDAMMSTNLDHHRAREIGRIETLWRRPDGKMEFRLEVFHEPDPDHDGLTHLERLQNEIAAFEQQRAAA